jgi:hypothetical protein
LHGYLSRGLQGDAFMGRRQVTPIFHIPYLI